MHLYSSQWTGISVTALLEAVWLLKLACWLLPSFWGQRSCPQHLHQLGAGGHPTRLHRLEEGRGLWLQHSNLGHSGASSRDACGTLPGCLLFCTSLSVNSCLPPPPCPLSALLELEPACVRLWRTVPLSNFRQRIKQRICPNYHSRVTAGSLNVRDKTDRVTKSESPKM